MESVLGAGARGRVTWMPTAAAAELPLGSYWSAISESRAAIWFKHKPVAGWAGKTAYDLVSEGKSDNVLAYLEAVRAGVHA